MLSNLPSWVTPSLLIGLIVLVGRLAFQVGSFKRGLEDSARHMSSLIEGRNRLQDERDKEVGRRLSVIEEEMRILAHRRAR